MKFGGCVLDTTGDVVKVYTDHEKVEKLKNFPTPKNRQELKSFLGMVRVFDHWSGNLVLLSKEMAKLQSEKNVFQWNEILEKEFGTIKEEISSEKYITAFNRDLPIELYCDASRLRGLGFVMV